MSGAIHSMTGFARAMDNGLWGNAVFELRSINHRYLEISIHLPEVLRELESAIRDAIRHVVKRGKVECYLRYHPGEAETGLMNVNMRLAEKICQASDRISTLLTKPSTTNPMDIVRWPGVLEMAEVNLEAVEDVLMAVLNKALQELVEVRAREGEDLKTLFNQRLDLMHLELSKVKEQLPQLIQEQRDKLLSRFQEARLTLDPHRLEQEMVMFTQRIDVTEEIDRLTTHIAETRRVLKHGGLSGRRLDFLMQELHREANTLGSKSVNVAITHASMELKVLIEQMREQVQNIE